MRRWRPVKKLLIGIDGLERTGSLLKQFAKLKIPAEVHAERQDFCKQPDCIAQFGQHTPFH